MGIDGALAASGTLILVTGIITVVAAEEARTYAREDRVRRIGLVIAAVGLLSVLSAIWLAALT